MAAMLDAESVK